MSLAYTQQAEHADGADEDAYRLSSVDPVHAPQGCVGPDWFAYRILQGANGITGYRRGTLAGVRAEVEAIVAALNERRGAKKSKPNAKVKGATAASIQLAGVK